MMMTKGIRPGGERVRDALDRLRAQYPDATYALDLAQKRMTVWSDPDTAMLDHVGDRAISVITWEDWSMALPAPGPITVGNVDALLGGTLCLGRYRSDEPMETWHESEEDGASLLCVWIALHRRGVVSRRDLLRAALAAAEVPHRITPAVRAARAALAAWIAGEEFALDARVVRRLYEDSGEFCVDRRPAQALYGIVRAVREPVEGWPSPLSDVMGVREGASSEEERVLLRAKADRFRAAVPWAMMREALLALTAR